MDPAIVIPRRFRGPPDSGNGGYSCGPRCELGRDGRKLHAATALFSESGSVVATCQQLWITTGVPPGGVRGG